MPKKAWPPPSPRSMAAAAAVPLLLPAAEKGGRALMELATTPVIGWSQIRTYDKGRKHPVHVEERRSINLAAWEIGVVALAGGVLYWVFNPPAGQPPPAWYTWPGLIRGTLTGKWD